MNFLLTGEFTKKDRTMINSILFCMEIGCAVIMLQVMALIYKFVMYSHVFDSMHPYNSFIVFGILAAVLLIPAALLSQRNYLPTKDRRTPKTATSAANI